MRWINDLVFTLVFYTMKSNMCLQDTRSSGMMTCFELMAARLVGQTGAGEQHGCATFQLAGIP